MALKQIKNKIVSTKKTGKVTKAMEAVSAVKMRKTQEQAFRSRAYARAAVKMLLHLAGTKERALKAYTDVRSGDKMLLVIVTSDKGLAGSVNSAVLKEASRLIERGSTDTVAIGRKAVEFARREGLGLIGEYTNVADDVTLETVDGIVRSVLEAYETGAYKTVSIVYQNFISTFEQKPKARQIFPLSVSVLEEAIADIKPAKGAYADVVEEEKHASSGGYTVEPDPETVIGVLVPQLVKILVFHALIESKASEHSARMVAMKNATDKAKEMTHSLTLVFNKERQAAITAEVSEITGGIEALKE
jgi:F-type H+-transporting ATPase subunit gamma